MKVDMSAIINLAVPTLFLGPEHHLRITSTHPAATRCSWSCVVLLLLQKGGTDPLHSKVVRHFGNNYRLFWDKLLLEAQAADILFDEFLLDKINNMVIALSWWVLLLMRCSSVP